MPNVDLSFLTINFVFVSDIYTCLQM